MDWIWEYCRCFWRVFSAMAPWLLFGYLAAGVIAYFLKPEQIKKHLGGRGAGAVLKAVLFGIPLPVCSCGVIPIAGALRNEGAGRGAVGAFFIATPQIGVDSAIVTGSMLGWMAAFIRALSALLSGLTGGFLISAFCPETFTSVPGKKKSCCCCCHGNDSDGSTQKKPWHTILSYGLVKMLKSTAPSLLLGIAVAALIELLVPEDFGVQYLKNREYLEFAAVLIFSIPLYICSTASVPVALALLLKGFSPGAALLFLIAGPTIHSVSIASMRQIIGGKAAVIAILSIAFWAVVFGAAVNWLDIPVSASGAQLISTANPGGLKTFCGIILALLVFRALVARQLEKYEKP